MRWGLAFLLLEGTTPRLQGEVHARLLGQRLIGRACFPFQVRFCPIRLFGVRVSLHCVILSANTAGVGTLAGSCMRSFAICCPCSAFAVTLNGLFEGGFLRDVLHLLKCHLGFFFDL